MRKIFLAGFVLSMAWSASAQTLSFRVTDIPIGTSGGSGIRVADFNNDGIPDIATLGAGYIGSVAIVLGNGDGTFKSPLYVPTQQSQTGFSISDLNLDGNMDLVVNEVDTNGNYGIYVYLGKGDGTFRIPIHVGSGSFGFVGGDFNGDGKPDLIVSTTGSSTASIALATGMEHSRRHPRVSRHCRGPCSTSTRTANSILLSKTMTVLQPPFKSSWEMATEHSGLPAAFPCIIPTKTVASLQLGI
jgi:hypothetical protein